MYMANSMVVLIKIFQVIIALSVLIVIHELGHFVFARLFGIKVDKFFLFFDAGDVKLFSTKETKWFTRLFPKMKDIDTEYGIGWLPVGGYCKINGMIDESMDTEMLRHDPKPWEFRSKPAWQRALVMVGGVLFNFIFAIIIYISMLSIWGNDYLSNKENRIYVNDLAYEMGFRTGDKILKFDDYEPEDFTMLQADLARRSVKMATVLRGQDTVLIYIDHSMIGEVLQSPGMFSIAIPFAVDSVAAGSVNAGSGLRHGDIVIKIDSTDIGYVQDAWKVLAGCAGRSIETEILRGNDTLSMPLQVDTTGKLGVVLQVPGMQKRTYTLAQAIPAGVKYTWNMVAGYVRDLKLVATPSTGAYKSVGSFIAIGQVFPSQWNWLIFMNLLALLSIMLGVMNLIPIPGLDGGHLLFLIYEMVSGKKPSDKFMIAAQILGMFILLLIMVLAFGNDIGRLL